MLRPRQTSFLEKWRTQKDAAARTEPLVSFTVQLPGARVDSRQHDYCPLLILQNFRTWIGLGKWDSALFLSSPNNRALPMTLRWGKNKSAIFYLGELRNNETLNRSLWSLHYGKKVTLFPILTRTFSPHIPHVPKLGCISQSLLHPI